MYMCIVISWLFENNNKQAKELNQKRAEQRQKEREWTVTDTELKRTGDDLKDKEKRLDCKLMIQNIDFFTFWGEVNMLSSFSLKGKSF